MIMSGMARGSAGQNTASPVVQLFGDCVFLYEVHNGGAALCYAMVVSEW